MMTERPLPSLAEVNWPAVVAAATAGYALGSLSPAAGAARLRGADLRGSGSGNPGATNAARTMGVKVGVIVGALDVAKGYAPVWYFDRYGDPCGQVAGLAARKVAPDSGLLAGHVHAQRVARFALDAANAPLVALPATARQQVTHHALDLDGQSAG